MKVPLLLQPCLARKSLSANHSRGVVFSLQICVISCLTLIALVRRKLCPIAPRIFFTASISWAVNECYSLLSSERAQV